MSQIPRILAHHLYEFADCEHRIALDARLPRERRTFPDEAARRLFEHGRDLERGVADTLGYPEIRVDDRDFRRAAAETEGLLRDGVRGVYQGVLLDGPALAQPDLLERVDGESALGPFHYVPGDVKAALAPRSDAALQVAFAARLLERLQGRRPATGFVVLGDGTREVFDLDRVWASMEDALERVAAVSAGAAATVPFFSRSCARCRWNGTCLPELIEGRDASLAFGLTRTLHRVLRRHGVGSLDDLAHADVAALRRRGAPTDGLDRLQRQARALLEGRIIERRPVELPRGARREHYLRIESDPLDLGEPFLLAWGSGAPRGGSLAACDVDLTSTPAERARAFTRLLASLDGGAAGEPVYVYGGGTAQAFDRLGDAVQIDPGRLGDLEGRLVDLAPRVRRAGQLPVFLYRFDEVAAVAAGTPRPDPASPEDALFADFASLGEGDDPGPRRRKLEDAGRRSVEGLRAIRAWLEAPR